MRPANHEPPEVRAPAAVVGGLFPACLFPVGDAKQNGPDGVNKTPPDLSPQSEVEIEAMTKFYGKAESAANVILDAFQNPGQLPAALAPIFITRKADIPCRKWSWNNQLITALAGHGDARGFRQWQQVDRHVRKGEKSFTILSPVTKKIKDPKTAKRKSP